MPSFFTESRARCLQKRRPPAPRVFDASFRGFARGASLGNLLKLSSQLYEFDMPTPAWLSASLFVMAVTTYSSYIGTSWWNKPLEVAPDNQSKRSSRQRTAQKMLDAFFRSLARAESTMSYALSICLLADVSIPILVGILGIMATGLIVWTSYQRAYHRRHLYTQLTDSQCNDEVRHRDCVKHTQAPRAIDAIYRGLARGASMASLLNMLGSVIVFSSKIPALVVSFVTMAITIYTSYTNTRWWENDLKKLTDLSSQNNPKTQKAQSMIDALFRALSRTESIINYTLAICLFAGITLPILAVAFLGLAGLVLNGWASYRRNICRRDYTARLIEQASNTEDAREDVSLEAVRSDLPKSAV
ncbi:MAG: hypothetical protein COV52_10130 [Gammaproteobacteria bacterium CG11_big_fil_rev_8_21_14_0_20_46_22]|nr:MAG: hypothetical protein COW05_09355 [Gammaproteobacteria bacterium CG12_big_fil_rev_8_21_14_0_65_46_12]PIR10054.1 MAG: hypothetical protein COV52_10130 [Gammaproteobacteria bacterium CG11_big_fil_rev_8_21_14_0_20_46_22]